MDPNAAQIFVVFANLLVELGDLDSAEKIYTDLAARNPAYIFDLARFLGRASRSRQMLCEVERGV